MFLNNFMQVHTQTYISAHVLALVTFIATLIFVSTFITALTHSSFRFVASGVGWWAFRMD